MAFRLKIAVFISGGGTTLKNLIAKRDAGALNVDIVLVISSRKTASGLKFADEANIATQTVRRKDFDSAESHSKTIFDACRNANVDLVVMGGFLSHVLIPDDFQNRVINIHPSLIPNFCGQGFYGLRVHQAVLDAGAKTTGCTVHYVDNIYDHGPVILQRSVTVREEDDAESLAARVFAVECEAYPAAIQSIIDQRESDVATR